MSRAAQEPFDPLAISKRIRSRYLIPGERVVVSTRRHWFRLAAPVTVVVLTFVAMVAGAFSTTWGQAAWVLVWLWLAACGYALWRVLEWRTEWFIATDRRLLKTYGLITQRVAMMPLAKVTDMSYDRSLLGRMLGYGEFVMESAGQDQALSKMDLIPEPEQKYVAMCETIFGRDVSDPGEDGEEWGRRQGSHDDGDDGEREDFGDRGDRPRRPRRPRWEPVERAELPEDWDWVDEGATRPREAVAGGPRRGPGRQVAVDPDPTPSR